MAKYHSFHIDILAASPYQAEIEDNEFRGTECISNAASQ